MKPFIFSLLVLAGLGIVSDASASSKEDISFPVSELGSCATEQECKTYCDDPAHLQACIEFGERHNLLSSEEAAHARILAEAGEGPAGCKTQRECEAYCNTLSHMEECIAFAEERGMIPASELAEAKQVLKALRAGVSMPGNCQNRQECEVYCEAPSHAEECVNFAVAAGFIPPEEAEMAKKMASFMAQGKMPGNCRDEQSCKTYCSEPSHTEECTTFFLEAGVMSSEEAEMFRKTGGKGPGGCTGQEECESFCNDPVNQQTCFSFARDHGLISEEELANVEEGMRDFREGLESAPAEVTSCLESTLGSQRIQTLKSGQLLPTPELGQNMKACFEQFTPKGPGGCSSPKECEAYCTSHPEECGMPSGPAPVESQGNECVARILGDPFAGPPTQEQEQRIREECFPEPEHIPQDEYQPHEQFPDEQNEKYQPEEQFEENFEQNYEGEVHEEPSASQLPGFLLEAARPLISLLLQIHRQ